VKRADDSTWFTQQQQQKAQRQPSAPPSLPAAVTPLLPPRPPAHHPQHKTNPNNHNIHKTQGLFKYHQYQVVGRHLPTAADPSPTVYRMKVWAPDAVCAKSKFWCVCVWFWVACVCSWLC
jgi:hypothetical protein